MIKFKVFLPWKHDLRYSKEFGLSSKLMFLLMMNILTFDTPYVTQWFRNSYLIFRRLHWTVGNGYESYVVVIPAMRWHLLDSFVKIWYNFPNMTQYWHQYNTNLKKVKENEVHPETAMRWHLLAGFVKIGYRLIIMRSS